MTALHVLFTVADADYVLPASTVEHMDSYEGATRVPGTPAWVAGLVQIRGRVLPVVDLRARFGLPPLPATGSEAALGRRVLVVQVDGRQVGLLVDAAREVVQIDPAQLKPPPDVVDRGAAGYVDAIAQAGTRLVMRVDPRRIVGNEALTVEANHGEQRN